MRNFLSKILPKNILGDLVFSLLAFVYFHRRLPKNKYIFNDKLFRLRINGLSDPLRVFVTDKEFVKIFVKSVIGGKYNVPTLAILKDEKEALNYKFPNFCCIKPTHLSGKVIFNRGKITKKNFQELKGWFKLNHYFDSREINYKYLIPKIIVEPIIFNDTSLLDYKFFCFNGRAKFIQVDINRFHNHTRKLFDSNWNDLNCSMGFECNFDRIEKPKNFQEMVKVVEQLAVFFDFIRVDLYTNGKKIYVGEITNCHGGSFEKFYPKDSEKKISDLLFEN